MEVLIGLVCFFVGLAIAIAFVTVIGHGLWTMFAAMFGSGPRRVEREQSDDWHGQRKCVGCGDEYSRQEFHCPACGLNPDSSAARELKDLQAAARTVERLGELQTLSAEICAEISNSIEARKEELLPRRRSTRREVTPTGITQLEGWFSDDLGAELSIADKKRALALARTTPTADLRKLSARTLVGIARLQASVGMLSRACDVYQTLLECHGAAAITADAAGDAIQIACKLEDWRRAEEFGRIISEIPGLLEDRPELAALIEQVRTRELDAAPEPTAPLPQIVDVTNEEPAVVYAIPAVTELPMAAAEAIETPVPVEPALPATPRRSFAEWIAVFMEEKNILWGELIGGTLIVGCSIALVISLWPTLEEKIPILPFVIFVAVTSGLMAAGLYTLHHWKLESTSRGLLLIGTLLVPLDFLVLAGLSLDIEAGMLDYAVEMGSFALFGWLLYRSSQVLVQTPLELRVPSALLVTASILVSAGAQLFTPRWSSHEQWGSFFLYLLSLLPVVVQVAALCWILFDLRKLESWSIARLAALLIALGATTFACGTTLSFPLYAGADIPNVLRHLAPAITLLGTPILIAGTLIHQKLARNGEGEESHGLWRTLGTGLALAGLFVMFGGFAVSVDDLLLRWLCGLVNIGTLLTVAWYLRVPVLHVPAQVYLAVLVVYGGTLDLDALMKEPVIALRLSALLVVQAIASEAMLRLGRRVDGRYYAVGSGVTTVLAGVLVIPFAASDPGIVAIVLGTASLTWFTANLRWRYAEITYACSLVLAGAILFAFRHFTDIPATEQLLWGLLTHATICLLAGMMLRFTSHEWLRDAFRIPLQFASLVATFFVAAIVVGEQFPAMLSWPVSCVASCWLAALWLTLAVLEGWPALFGGFQIALAAAWIFGAGGWLVEHGWDWREPHSLHIYALGLGACSLAWELARIAARSRPRTLALLSPTFVPVDRLITGLLIVGQFALCWCVISWGVGRELSERPDLWRILPAAWHDHAYSFGAWLLPALLAGVLIVWLREFDMTLPLLGLTLLVLTLPLLIAGAWFDDSLAAASAARWGLAICYGVCSLALWQRHRLGAERAAQIPALVIRAMLAIGAVLPVLFVTVEVVVRKLSHIDMPGPLNEAIFRQMGGPASLLVPLTMISATLAGHGFRERLSYYLLAAGLLANASSIGGYFLALPEGAAGEPHAVVDALLLAAGVAWLWSIVWTWLGSVLEKAEPRPLLDSLLLTLNNLLGSALFGVVLLRALEWIMFHDNEPGRLWTLEAGSPWSWLVYTLMAAGSCFACWRRRAALPLHLLGLLSLTAVGVIACSVEGLSRGDGFVALMFLSGAYSCVWVWSNLFIDAKQPPHWLSCSSSLTESVTYAVLPGILAAFLGCFTFFTGTHAVWSAESIALAALACGFLAHQRKTEIWATLAVPLMMLATTMLTLHFGKDETHLFLLTIQLNLAVVGAMSLLRLGLHRLLAPADVELSRMIHLPAQIALGMGFNGLLAFLALLTLVIDPDNPGEGLRASASWAAWLALATNAASALWQVGVVQPRAMLLFVAITGLQVGVLLAGTADSLWLVTPWLAHHVMTISWTVLGSMLLAVSWLTHTHDALGPRSWPTDRRDAFAAFLRQCFPATPTRIWVSVCGALVVAMALRAAGFEPASPYWPVGNTFAVSVLLGALTIWSGSALYLFASGLLFNVIGVLIFTAWTAQHPNLTDDEGISYFLLTQVLSFGSAAIVWSLLERVLQRKQIAISHGIAPFTQAALLGGLLLLATEVVFINGLHLTGQQVHVVSAVAWAALAALIAPTLLEMWRPQAHRFTRLQLYLCGLLAIGILLHDLTLSNADWYWAATLLLAGYVLLIAVLLRLADFSTILQDILHVSTLPNGQGRWFWQVQLVTVGLVLVLSMWITLTFATWHDRLGGALACSLVTVAAFLFAQVWPRIDPIDEATPTAIGLHHRLFPNWLVLTLGFVIVLETWWAFLDAPVAVGWMQRNAAAMALATAAALLYRFMLPRWSVPSWGEAGRSLSAILCDLSIGLLVLLLGQELLLYDIAEKRTPLRIELAVFCGLAIFSATVYALYLALTKETDPHGIEGERRSIYVYVAEILALLLFVHFKLNVPALPKLLGTYWYLAVMVLAFAGLALSEIFARKAMPILAAPLKHTSMGLAFVPVIFFLLLPIAGWIEPLDEHIKGLHPFLAYLKGIENAFVWHALCWLLLGIFFGCLAQLRRSANYGIVAALAINFGLWVLLNHLDATHFLQRPQLWLIPLGLIVLVAEFINRDRLGFWPSLSVRYVGLVCIYMSSTFEMFKELVHTDPIYPIALALLAVAGMLLGILFRVRAFLLSGFLALLIVIFAQIWNAAVHHSHTWVWWASGIILGVVILAMFALFEKHRNEVLKMLDNMKRWN